MSIVQPGLKAALQLRPFSPVFTKSSESLNVSFNLLGSSLAQLLRLKCAGRAKSGATPPARCSFTPHLLLLLCQWMDTLHSRVGRVHTALGGSRATLQWQCDFRSKKCSRVHSSDEKWFTQNLVRRARPVCV